MRKRVTLVLVSAVLAACLTACHHVPLYDPLSGLYLNLTVVQGPRTEVNAETLSEAPENSQRRLQGSLPEVMNVYVYDAKTHALVTEEKLPLNGGFIDVGEGVYDIIVYGMRSDVNGIKGAESLGSIRACTGSNNASLRMTRSDGDEETNFDYTIYKEPDHIYVATAENIVVFPRAEEKGLTVVEMNVATVVDSYTFQAINIEGIENIGKLSCYITGLVPEKYLWDGRLSDEVSAIPMEAVVDQEKKTITGAFNTFGKHPRAYANVYMNVLVTNGSGQMYQWIYDLSDQFTNPDNLQHQLIVSQKIDIPGADAGGFSPTVENWNTVVTVVPL